MALLIAEGFEHDGGVGQLSRIWNTNAGGSGIDNLIGGRKQGLSLGGRGLVLEADVGHQDTFIINWAMLFSDKPNINHASRTVQFSDAVGAEQFRVEVRAFNSPYTPLDGETYFLRLMRGAVELGEVGPFGSLFWQQFEMKVRIHATLGTIELKHIPPRSVTPVTLFNQTGLNTAEQGTSGADRVGFEGGPFVGGGFPIYDDILVMNDQGGNFDDFQGPVTIVGRLPAGEGNSLDWLPLGSVNHFQNVDDVRQTADPTPDDSNRNTADTIGLRDLYIVADIGNIISDQHSILGVQVKTTAAMEATGSRTLEVRHRDSGGSESGQGSHVLTSTTFSTFLESFAQNPSLVAPWTLATIDGSEFGVEVTA